MKEFLLKELLLKESDRSPFESQGFWHTIVLTLMACKMVCPCTANGKALKSHVSANPMLTGMSGSITKVALSTGVAASANGWSQTLQSKWHEPTGLSQNGYGHTHMYICIHIHIHIHINF